MNTLTRFSDRRASWRLRFLEIARQAEAAAERPAVHAIGLRPRSRMAGFASLGRSRRLRA